jgi:hypothetical protein
VNCGFREIHIGQGRRLAEERALFRVIFDVRRRHPWFTAFFRAAAAVSISAASPSAPSVAIAIAPPTEISTTIIRAPRIH